MEYLCYGCMNKKTQRPVCEHCGFSEVSNNMGHQLPIGMILQDQYVVGRVLGQGGFGITYIGWDQNLNRKIAIKEYFPQGMVRRGNGVLPTVSGTTGGEDFQTGKKRFLLEAQTLAKLQNVPEIAKVYNYFSTNGTAYIVMEYVEGITLEQYVRSQGGRLDPQRAIALLRPVMTALAKVHRAGIIHRDISPDNIMLQRDGSIRLLDFGTARDTARRRSTTQNPILKHGFAPMEQYQVNGTIGPWTDEYALCATLYFCMTGHKPMEAPALLMDKTHIDWERIPGLNPNQQAVLQTATAMKTEDRYPSMEALLAAFDRGVPPIRGGRGTPTNGYTPGGKPKPKWLLPVIGVAAAALLAFVLLPGGETDEPAPTEPVETHSIVATEPTNAPVQLTGIPVMMADTVEIETDEDSMVAPVFGSSITRQEIYTVTFLDSLDNVGAGAWDISKTKNGSIMAWVEESDVDPASLPVEEPEEGEETEPTLPPIKKLYNLYIAGDGGVVAPESCKRLFMGYCNADAFYFNGVFYTQQVRDMRSMFDCCKRLTNLDVSGFDTSMATDMAYMFYDCKNLLELDVSGFNTSKVTEMDGMFYGCKSLTQLDVSGFDTSRVLSGNYMFYHCENLTQLDVSGFDTSEMMEMKSMFSGCNSVKALDVYGFDTANCENFRYMFAGCGALKELDVSSFDTSSGTDFESMFEACTGLKTIDVTGFDMSSAVNVSGMFYECRGLEYVDVSNFNTANVENFSFLFARCNALKAVDVSGFNTSSATDISSMFSTCKTLTEVDVSGFDTSKVTAMNHMFYGCTNLKKVDVSGFKTSNVTTMRSMFSDCVSLTNLDVSNFDMRNVTAVNWMFSGCGGQEAIARTCGKWNVSSVTEYNNFMDDGVKINGRPWEEFFR